MGGRPDAGGAFVHSVEEEAVDALVHSAEEELSCSRVADEVGGWGGGGLRYGAEGAAAPCRFEASEVSGMLGAGRRWSEA